MKAIQGKKTDQVLYRWQIEETGEYISLPVKPLKGNELKPHFAKVTSKDTLTDEELPCRLIYKGEIVTSISSSASEGGIE